MLKSVNIISTYIEEIEELFEGGRGWGTLNGRVGSVGENQNSKHTDRETHAHFLPRLEEWISCLELLRELDLEATASISRRPKDDVRLQREERKKEG